MGKDKPDLPPEIPDHETSGVSPEQLAQVQEILQLLGHTVSAMKLFPLDHASVKKFVDDLWEKLKGYLETYWKLEIGIEENAFTFEGNVVYQDLNPMKSLPFLFCKDGMQMLFFYRDLDREELQSFLEVIRKDSHLPPEESDVVLSLWEKDLTNVRYFAPDDYLESKIGGGRAKISFDVDRRLFRSGRIELTAQDKAAIEKSRSAADSQPGSTTPFPAAESADMPADEEDGPGFGTLDSRETGEIEKMLQLNRKISTEEEFINVLLEILYLEDRTEQFAATLEILEKHHQGLVEKGDLASDYLLLSEVNDLKGVYSPDDERARQIGKFLIKAGSEEIIRALKKTLKKGLGSNFPRFFEYLDLLGAETIPLVAELYETRTDLGFRERAADSLEKNGRENLPLLVSLAHDSKPELTKLIISILGRLDAKKALHYFARFTNFKDPAIKVEAAQTLGKFPAEMANKILLGFLNDDDSRVRLAAVNNLHVLPERDQAGIESVLHLVSTKSFDKKDKDEKRAVFFFLIRNQTPEVSRFFGNLLKKSGHFMNSSRVETRLCAIEALEKAKTHPAIGILKEAVKSGNKRIRREGAAALGRVTGAHPAAEPKGE